MSTLTILAIVAAILALPAVYNLIRRGDLRRMGVRNIVRRPVESALIIVGSALGTAIIVAALMIGDTFDNSIRDIARTGLGEVDAAIEFETVDELDAAYVTLSANRSELTELDGMIAVRLARVAAAGAGTGDDRMVEPSIAVSALDFADATAFGADPAGNGLRTTTASPLPASPAADEIVINDDLAEDLGVTLGDPVSLFVSGNELVFTVVGVVEDVGLGGYSDAFVTRDLIDVFDPVGDLSYNHLALSATGEVYDSVDATRRLLVDQVEPALLDAAIPFDSDPIKKDLLDDAEDEGAELTQIFSVVGGFSVLAGVLLLVNLFVMLAEERKPNLGVLRAIGWKRSSLRKAFRAEGVIYATIAAAVGAILGVGVGWVIVQLTKGILAGANPDSDFQLQLAVEVSSLVTAGLIGLIIAMAAVWFTSWRISRLNIISAIRDLPEPKTRRSRLLVMGAGVLLIVGGGLMLSNGLASDNAFLTIASVPIAATGAAIIAKSFMSPLVVSGITGVIAVVWGAAFFPLMPAAMTQDVDIEFFLLFGVVVVAGGVALTTVLGPTIQKLVTRGNRPMVEARVAMAYPSARLFRTAASLAMYGLIIFTLAFMAVLSNSFSLQTTDIAASTAAGHDVMVQSNRTNPIVVDDLEALDGVSTVSPLIRDSASFTAPWDPGEPDEWGFVGVEPDFASIGSPMLRDRDPRFATDQEALAAVATDPSLLLVPTWFLGQDDGNDPPIGGIVNAETTTGTELTFEIVGVTNNDFAWSGPWMSAQAARELRPDAQANRLYVAADPGVDTKALAETIEARFLPNGAEAETFTGRVQRFVEADEGFFSLLRGYLLLGLVIGIAGLAVSLFRAVRERRRQIGMMRAMGLLGSGVRRWFMTEATFISVMGIATGVGLGMLTGYLSVTRSTAFDEELPFGVPWGVILFITIVPFAASALAAIIPARRAARLRPSEALRLAD
jgi:putative ABC transport system permease protein